MSASVIITGLDKWERFTKPCIDSIVETNISMSVVVVDNGSAVPYEKHRPCFTLVRNPERGSLSEGLNMGWIEAGKQDWYIFTNNDVLFHQPIYDRLHALSPDNLYGFMLYDKVFTRPYLSGWCLFVSWKLISAVGLFDEKFAPMWFEDADYSFRAVDKGFGLVELRREEWGIEHLGRGAERKDLINKYIGKRTNNRKHLEKKHGVTSL